MCENRGGRKKEKKKKEQKKNKKRTKKEKKPQPSTTQPTISKGKEKNKQCCQLPTCFKVIPHHVVWTRTNAKHNVLIRYHWNMHSMRSRRPSSSVVMHSDVCTGWNSGEHHSHDLRRSQSKRCEQRLDVGDVPVVPCWCLVDGREDVIGETQHDLIHA